MMLNTQRWFRNDFRRVRSAHHNGENCSKTTFTLTFVGGRGATRYKVGRTLHEPTKAILFGNDNCVQQGAKAPLLHFAVRHGCTSHPEFYVQTGYITQLALPFVIARLSQWGSKHRFSSPLVHPRSNLLALSLYRSQSKEIASSLVFTKGSCTLRFGALYPQNAPRNDELQRNLEFISLQIPNFEMTHIETFRCSLPNSGCTNDHQLLLEESL